MNLKCEDLLALEMEDESKADPFALFKLEASDLGLEGDERAKYIQDRAIEEAEWEACMAEGERGERESGKGSKREAEGERESGTGSRDGEAQIEGGHGRYCCWKRSFGLHSSCKLAYVATFR